MKETIQRDAFKFSVGRAIFCSIPECGVILDWKRAAEFSACKGDKYVSIKVFCADCADRMRPEHRKQADGSWLATRGHRWEETLKPLLRVLGYLALCLLFTLLLVISALAGNGK